MRQNKAHVRLRDWDGGDLLDIVGNDWMGWQEDALQPADCVVHLTGGGFTEQRVLACERLVRESLRVNPNAFRATAASTMTTLVTSAASSRPTTHDVTRGDRSATT